jgi:hypothetical protein
LPYWKTVEYKPFMSLMRPLARYLRWKVNVFMNHPLSQP